MRKDILDTVMSSNKKLMLETVECCIFLAEIPNDKKEIIKVLKEYKKRLTKTL